MPNHDHLCSSSRCTIMIASLLASIMLNWTKQSVTHLLRKASHVYAYARFWIIVGDSLMNYVACSRQSFMLTLCSPVDECWVIVDTHKGLCMSRQCYTICRICIEKERWQHLYPWFMHIEVGRVYCVTTLSYVRMTPKERNFGLKCATCVYVVTHNFNG